jgi:hypothetical protein
VPLRFGREVLHEKDDHDGGERGREGDRGAPRADRCVPVRVEVGGDDSQEEKIVTERDQRPEDEGAHSRYDAERDRE